MGWGGACPHCPACGPAPRGQGLHQPAHGARGAGASSPGPNSACTASSSGSSRCSITANPSRSAKLESNQPQPQDASHGGGRLAAQPAGAAPGAGPSPEDVPPRRRGHRLRKDRSHRLIRCLIAVSRGPEHGACSERMLAAGVGFDHHLLGRVEGGTLPCPPSGGQAFGGALSMKLGRAASLSSSRPRLAREPRQSSSAKRKSR